MMKFIDEWMIIDKIDILNILSIDKIFSMIIDKIDNRYTYTCHTKKFIEWIFFLYLPRTCSNW